MLVLMSNVSLYVSYAVMGSNQHMSEYHFVLFANELF